ncbi:MAG: hypothetical protein JSV52_13750 [Candidatus Zixiibacteriota bacterium]|nr:MAG: hypothetical protein JSV52_13750 [candidate division Zixibacteria bacterium]
MKSLVYIGTCLVAFIYPILYPKAETRQVLQDYEFITTFQGSELAPLEMGETEQRFYNGFPGRTGYFRVKGRPGESVFIRYTETPTRMLHSVEGCYRAAGYDVQFTDNVVVSIPELSSEVLHCSQFRIAEDEHPYLVRQCIVSMSSCKQYSDIPAWYWQTMFSSRDNGPWLAVTWKLPDQSTVP